MLRRCQKWPNKSVLAMRFGTIAIQVQGWVCAGLQKQYVFLHVAQMPSVTKQFSPHPDLLPLPYSPRFRYVPVFKIIILCMFWLDVKSDQTSQFPHDLLLTLPYSNRYGYVPVVKFIIFVFMFCADAKWINKSVPPDFLLTLPYSFRAGYVPVFIIMATASTQFSPRLTVCWNCHTVPNLGTCRFVKSVYFFIYISNRWYQWITISSRPPFGSFAIQVQGWVCAGYRNHEKTCVDQMMELNEELCPNLIHR